MAYNNFYPNYNYPTYPNYPQYQTAPQQIPQAQQQIPQQTQQPVQPQQIQNGGFISVHNENEAKMYPVAPGNSVTFIDENAPYCYTKTMGFSQLDRPKFEKYRLVKEEDTQQPITPPTSEASTPERKDVDYITRAEYEGVIGEINGISSEIGLLKKELAELKKESPKTEVKKTTRTKKEVDEA